MQSEQINELATALAKAQGAMENAVFNKINPHFKSKYADLASMRDAIIPALSANGLAVTQLIEIHQRGPDEFGESKGLILRTILMHSSGQWLASEYPLPIGRPQEMGSAQTYARRYSLAALVCNSSEEDDDANAAEAGAKKANGKHVQGGDAADMSAPISAEQLKEIQQLMIEVGADIPKFCKYFKLNILADLPQYEFDRAKKALTAKRGT